MGQVANEVLARDSNLAEIVDRLDRLYCYHMAGMCWSLAMDTRLKGQALFLLGDELKEVADEHLTAARALAQRITELGAAITADPTHLLERSPLDDVRTPDPSDIEAILRYALAQVRIAVRSYGQLLDRTRGSDDLSHHLLIKLARQQARRETDLEGALPP